MNKFTKVPLLATVSAFVLFSFAGAAFAASAVNLGAANNFAILAGSTITNTGSTVINGDLGLSPGTSVTGFPPGTVNGTQHITDGAAGQAQIDLVAAYNNAAGQTPATSVPVELGGTTKTAGVYTSAPGTFSITGTLTLDGQGDPNAVFIFKTASTLITAGASDVILINGAQACNVFWQVGSSATLGTNASFKGNVMAMQSVTLTNGANVEGSVLARGGAVTLDANIVNRATCAVPPPAPAPVVVTPVATSTPTPVVTPVTVTPTPVTPTVVPTVSPTLPNTGFDSSSISWDIIAIGAVVGVMLAAYWAARKKRSL